MRIIFLCLIVTYFSIPQSYANTLIKKNINGFNLEVVEYEANSPDFDLRIGLGETGGSSLKEIMNSVGGISGVTGVFTCPKDYSACGGETTTINERYVEGKKISTYRSTGERVVFGWTKAYEAFIFQTDKINGDREPQIYEGLANHPLLILDGIPMTQTYWEKGLIDSKMRSKGTRNFICANEDSSLFYFGLVNLIDIDNLAIVLKKLGCHNAINLDAGFTTAMIYNGEYTRGPGRDMLDGVFIVPKNIDIKLQEEKAKKIAQGFDNKLKKYRQERRISTLEPISPKIDTFLVSLNKQFTTNIMALDFVGNEVIDGQRTQLSTQALERVYLLTSLQSEIAALIKKYKTEIKTRDNTPVFDLLF